MPGLPNKDEGTGALARMTFRLYCMQQSDTRNRAHFVRIKKAAGSLICYAKNQFQKSLAKTVGYKLSSDALKIKKAALLKGHRPFL